MEMTMRWYTKNYDTVTLEQIRQTAYVKGVITMLYDKQPGDLWTQEEIHALKEEVEAAGLHISGIELFFEPEEEDITNEGIKYKSRIIPFFDIDAIETTLCQDLREEEL